MDAVREALERVLRGTVSHQLIEVARSAASAGEEGQDALYAAAGRLIGSQAYRGAAHPALVRAALVADEDLPEGPEFQAVVHLVAAIGLGAQEVGPDALAEVFASYGMFGLTVEDLVRMLGAAEQGEGPSVDWGLLQQHADVLGPVQRASDEDLVRARTVLLGLRVCGVLRDVHDAWAVHAGYARAGRAAGPDRLMVHGSVPGPHDLP
ncbi:hypothetical protein AB0E67_35690 [Streptomyces sp. NPDC032161]|uniref:hypothetical protein n=1 Tax=unclassified Streptomyces TaxID=2593676 RepID=UPI0034015D9D